MPFSRPTATQLINQVLGDISAGLASVGALLRFSNLRIAGKALAKAASGMYGYLDYIAKQATPFTATDEYLVGWAALKRVILKSATKATGTVTFTGTDGYLIPAGSSLVRASDQVAFVTTGEVTIVAGTATAPVAAVDAGAAANGSAGAKLTLTRAIAGIASSGTSFTSFTGGADVESPDDLRSRMLQKYAAPPQGGAAPDYVEWATEVAGVTRAWVRRNGMGAGTVVVYFMMDDAQAANGGFPQGTNGVAALEDRDLQATGDQLAVADAIFPLQTVGALVYAVAPGQNVLDFTIAGIAGATVATKAAIRTAIVAAIALGSSPGGISLSSGGAGGVTLLSTIESAIGAVPAAAGFVITLVAASHGTVTPGAAGNVTANTGYLSVLGAVTYV